MNVNFVELAKYCQEQYKASFEEKTERFSDKYLKTWYVAVMDDDSLLISMTPHILANACKCILIHERSSLAVTNWYSWYFIQFINEKGEVLDERIDEEFELCIRANGSYLNQTMYLSADRTSYGYFKWPWEKSVKSLWNLYVRLKKSDSTTERRLVATLFKQEEKIVELEGEKRELEIQERFVENERDMYKNLLDDIKKMVNGSVSDK